MSLLRLALVGLIVAAAYGLPPANAADAAPTSSASAAAALSSARVGLVELHYEERGEGEPIVFVHGSLVDYTEWGPVARQLEDRYRTITADATTSRTPIRSLPAIIRRRWRAKTSRD